MKSKGTSMSLAALSAVLLLNLPLVANAQTLINGANETGTILATTTNSYTFTANAGDSINLRLGSPGFAGNLELLGPTGAVLGTSGDNSTDHLIAYRATTSGTFTVLVSSFYGGFYSGGTGAYVLNLSQIPEPFIVPAGDGGGPLTNGADATGTITLGDQDMWSFTANKGDSINVRLGSTFAGSLKLYGPTGALLGTAADNSTDHLIAYTATNSGTFTVLVSAFYSGGTGTYALNLAQMPEPFIVPAGDDGGPLTNGADATGTITLGDQDMWSFTANKGDSINVRLGSTFAGSLKLYGPTGALLGTAADNSTDHLIAYTATNSGTFTVLVSAFYSGGTGTYALNLAQMPEPFIVPAGDDGGPLTNGADATGTITLGDQDMWSFTANKGDSINVRLGTTGFAGNLELYGPSGALLVDAGNNAKDELIAYTATTNGAFTVLVSGYFGTGTGTYVLNLSQIPEPFIVPAGDGGGTLTNGANSTGTITLGRQDLWSFTANKGDSINVRLGTIGFPGNLELYGPTGALLVNAANNATDELIAYTSTTNGTFTVLVSADFSSSYGIEGGTGTYVLNLSQIPEPFIVPAGDGGGTLTNGANSTGTITLGRQDLWSFTANKGDSINVRLGTIGFPGNLELYGPTGALLVNAANNATDELIAYTSTTNGTFTVLVSADFSSSYGIEGGTGTYVLNLSQIPEPFIVPAGDGGGTLTNGANSTGTITLGRQDLWSFTANKGDSINVRLGTIGFPGNLELYGPTGALLVNAANNATDELIAYTSTTNGTFTVLVSADFSSSYGIHGGTGTYVLNLAQMPEPFIVSSGEQGGPMTGSASYAGTITLGDQDMFSFTACTGDSINLGLNTTFNRGNLELYGPKGALLKSDGNSAALSIAYTATNCGTFTVLVSAYFSSSYGIEGGTGTYVLTVNGLVYELRECLPKISGTNFTFNGVGGNNYANAGFVLYSTTNLATPFGLWTPVLTNQFDQFGVFGYTNIYNPAQRQQFFGFRVP